MSFGGKPKSVKPPAMQPAAQQTQRISEQALKAGGAERRRLRRQRGVASNILTSPSSLGAATTQAAGLKTTFG